MALKSNVHFMCNGCKRGYPWTATGYQCKAFSWEGRVAYARLGGCPFNKEVAETQKHKVRVGQQKQRKRF